MIRNIPSANISFQGLYLKANTINKTIGRANIDKRTYMLYKFKYYPFENESAEFIKKQIEEHTFGRTFVLWEKDHGQQEGDYYSMNLVTEGTRISEKDKDVLISKGYSEKPVGGVLDYNNFMKTYNNESYGTMDVASLDSSDVKRIVEKEKLVD